MKKVKWTCSKFENRVAHLGILGLKIALLALKLMQWRILLQGTDLGHSKYKAPLQCRHFDVILQPPNHTFEIALFFQFQSTGLFVCPSARSLSRSVQNKNRLVSLGRTITVYHQLSRGSRIRMGALGLVLCVFIITPSAFGNINPYEKLYQGEVST